MTKEYFDLLLLSVDALYHSSSGHHLGQVARQVRKGPAAAEGGSAFVSFDEQHHLHVLIATPQEAPLSVKRVQLRSVSVGGRVLAGSPEWPKGTYVDISLSIDASKEECRPFLALVNEILISLDAGKTPWDAVVGTCLRWRRFWAAPANTAVSVEWLLGLHGEMMFLKALIQSFGPNAVWTWRGGEAGQDHDFHVGEWAVEVKTTTQSPPMATFGITQLDSSIVPSLWLVLGVCTEHDGPGAVSLYQAVSDIEALLTGDDVVLDVFHERLNQAKYRPDQEAEYRRRRFSIDTTKIYAITGDFPRLTPASFKQTPGQQVRNIKYELKFVGVEPYEVTLDALLLAMPKLS